MAWSATRRARPKGSERLSERGRAPRGLARAFEQLTGGRPRPVALECPWDTLGEKALMELELSAPPAAPPPPDPEAIEQAAQLIGAAVNPLIMVGSGALAAGAEVLELAQTLQAPVTAHRSRRGSAREDTPYGMNLAAAYRVWPRTDVLVAIGTRMELQFIAWKHVPPGLRSVR